MRVSMGEVVRLLTCLAIAIGADGSGGATRAVLRVSDTPTRHRAEWLPESPAHAPGDDD